jgi:parallel beta-helix repeat protein
MPIKNSPLLRTTHPFISAIKWLSAGALALQVILLLTFQSPAQAQPPSSAPNNAGILAVDSPAVPICQGKNPVYATFENQGTSRVNTITYALYFNGSLLKTGTIPVKLDTLGGNASYSADTSLLLGNPSFTNGGNSVEVRIRKVNGQTDTVNGQDTFRLAYPKTALNGNYSIGTSSADYNSVSAAVSDLNARGVCGSVDFNIRNGTYTLSATASINQIPGASAAQDIDFQGQGINASKITGTLQNSLFELNSASHVSFNQLHLENTGANFNTQVITLRGQTNQLQVTYCKLSLNRSRDPGMVIETFGGSDCNDLVFRNNTIEGGSYNLQLLGNPTNVSVVNNQLLSGYFGGLSASDGRGIMVDSNKVEHTSFFFVSTGIWIQDFTNANIRNNTVEGNWRDGITIENTNNATVSRNQVKGFGTFLTPTSGIYLNEANAARVQNNFVRSTSSSANGILLETTDSSSKVFHNSVRVNNNAIRLRQGSEGQVINNNLKTTDARNALVYEATRSDGYFNANNYDFPPNGLIYANDQGQSYRKLTEWQAIPAEYRQRGTYDNRIAYTRDAQFRSATDLHLTSSKAFPRGVWLNVRADIDGDSRCQIGPSIGADESAFTGTAASLNVQIPDTVNLKAPIPLANQGPRTGHQYNWYLNGQLVSSNTYEPTIRPQQLGPDTLMVIDQACTSTDTLMAPIQVKAPAQPPEANFVADANVLFTNEALPLKDLSTGGVAGWEWLITPENAVRTPARINYTFVKSSDQNRLDRDSTQNPHVQFLKPEVYDVRLRVFNYDSAGNKRYDTLQKIDYLQVNNSFQICQNSSTKAQQGVLYDNGGPERPYRSAQSDVRNNCRFTIDPCADSLVLSLKTLDLFTNGCGDEDTDYLRIYDGQDASGQPLWSSSQQCPDGITGSADQSGFDSVKVAASGAAHIVFSKRTDEDIGYLQNSGDGFAVEWEAKGSNFTKPSARIQGPDTVCINQQATYHAAQVASNPKGAKPEREWYLNSLTGSNPVSDTTYSFSGSAPGLDTINLLTSQCALTDTATKRVFVEQPGTLTSSGFKADIRKPEVKQGVVTLTNKFGSCANQANWTITPDSFRFVNGTSANSLNPEVVFQDTVNYSVKLISGNTGATDTVTKRDYIKPIDRCEPSVAFTNPDVGISRFSLGEIDNRSAIGKSGYTDYTSGASAILEQGVSYDFTVERNTSFNAVTRKIWIDYNRDGDFTDSNARFDELVAKQVQSRDGTWQGSFKVRFPQTGATRLRVGVFYNDGSGPCGQPQFGEYEDYRVRISEDVTPPEIQLSGPDTLYLNACESLTGRDTGARATDNFLGNITDSLQVTSQVDTATPGTYTIDYEVYDADSNRAFRQRPVVVRPENTKPSLTLLGADTTIQPVNQPYQDPGYTALDACSGIQTTDTLNTVNPSRIGTDTVRYSITDSAGNTNRVARLVRVVDTTAPTIQLNPDTVRLGVNATYTPDSPQISDNYWPESSLNLERKGEVNTEKVGRYTLTYRVTDSSDNGPATANQTVIVQDTTDPEITPQVKDSLLTIPVYQQLTLDQLVANVSDNYYEADQLQVTRSGSFYSAFADEKADSLGTFTARVQYTDPSGNSLRVQQAVKVVDHQAPELALTGPSLVKVQRWQETPFVDSVRVTDNYYASDQVALERSGSYFSDYIDEDYPAAPATYEIQYQAVDPSGNSSAKVYRYVAVQAPTTGVSDEPQKAGGIRAYPNPTDGNVRIQTDWAKDKRFQLEILNTMGQVVRQTPDRQASGSTYQFDLTGLAVGIYQIRIETTETVYTEQLILK